jgi:hypothetical protein
MWEVSGLSPCLSDGFSYPNPVTILKSPCLNEMGAILCFTQPYLSYILLMDVGDIKNYVLTALPTCRPW